MSILEHNEQIVTGVGSRDTPSKECFILKSFVSILTTLGYMLRSGGAKGADTACFEGWKEATYKSKIAPEIYVPDINFRNNEYQGFEYRKIVQDPCILQRAEELVKEVHPAFHKLSKTALNLHIRNCFQVLGGNLDKPSNLLVCYAKIDSKGEPTGGTRTAIKIAEMYGIRVYNISRLKDLSFIQNFIKEFKV